jgi:two-component sensor histidine kinase
MADPLAPNLSRSWIHWVSAGVLPGLLLLESPLYSAILARGYGSLLLAAGPLTLAGCCALWFHGMREAGTGLRRGLFLAAFAGSLTMVGASVSSFARGFYDGLRAGPTLAPPVPASPGTTLGGMVDWIFLTALLGVLLHLFEKHRSEAARQRSLAEQSREELLRTRLAPHFIFNCLNTLKAQIASDPAAAEATTDRLASLFRQVVTVADRATHPLSEEIHFVETYLGLEKARLGARLQVEIDLPEALEACPVLPLSLQVLVENAVKHGVSPREEGGLVRIQAMRDGDSLLLRVEDPGTGLGAGGGTGTALATLRSRLSHPGDLAFTMVDGRHCATLRGRV